MKVLTVLCIALAAVNSVAARSLFQASAPSSSGLTDTDILNFALNLEYLEAEFYSCAAFGTPLPTSLRGGGPANTNCQKATLSPTVQAYANEIANNEIGHVTLLRQALGSAAVPIPQLNIGSSFSDLANAAIGGTVTPPFSPYANDLFFMLGSFAFEDVGVTAYEGAIGQIQNPQYLQTAAKIAAVEAYQGGIVRAFLYLANNQNNGGNWPYKYTIANAVEAIADLRSKASGDPPPDVDDEGILNGTTATLTPVDANKLVFARTPSQVIQIVTLGKGPSGGGFLPAGLSGNLNVGQ